MEKVWKSDLPLWKKIFLIKKFSTRFPHFFGSFPHFWGSFPHFFGKFSTCGKSCGKVAYTCGKLKGVCGKIWVPMWKTMLTENMEIVTKILKNCDKYYKIITNITKLLTKK